MRIVVVGAGGIARELVRRLGENWDVVVIDTEEERLARIEPLRPLTTVVGDGSSRVTLNRAGVTGADAVVAATDDDVVNLEICRLARESGIARLVAVAADPEHVENYREVGVAVASPDSLAARRVEVNLESRRIVSTAFADGRAEAIEFRVADDSPVRGRALKELHAQAWIVGSVLRGDRLIIPHGETVLQTGDLVTVVGASSDFSEIVRSFTAGEGRFPLDYGKRVAVALDDEFDLAGPFPEAVHLVRNSRAFSLVVVHRDPDSLRDDTRAERVRALLERASKSAEGVELRFRPVTQRPARTLAAIPASASIGTIVVGVAEGRGLGVWRSVRFATAILRRTRLPVLLSRGRQPYRRVVTPVRQTPSGMAAARAAIDLARFSKAELHGLAVIDPEFLGGPEAPDGASRAVTWLEEDASMQRVTLKSEIRRGNPVRTFLEFAGEDDLLVLAAERFPWHTSPRGGIASVVAKRARGTVLLVPTRHPPEDDD